MKHWIKVDDQSPSMGEPVLTWGADENPIPAYMVNGQLGPIWLDYADDEHLVGITHWTYLPPPPK